MTDTEGCQDRSAQGLPGLTGVDHIGFTVPDLEQARSFLVDVLGCEYLYSLGPYQHDDDWMAEHLQVHPRAVMQQLHFFRCGTQAIFEVFQYSAPDNATSRPATAISAVIMSPSTSRTWIRRSPTCAATASRVLASRQPATDRAPASAGSTSLRRGACSSSSCPTPTARHSKRALDKLHPISR